MSNQGNFLFELSIRGMKMLDIGVLFAIGSAIGYIFGQLLSKLFKFDNTKQTDRDKYCNTAKGRARLITRIILEISFMGIIMYIARQFIQLLKWPFDGYMGINPPSGFKGYDHDKVPESTNPFPIMFFIIYYNTSLKNKIAYLNELMNIPMANLNYTKPKK